MKTIISFLFLFVLIISHAQGIADYRYISVPSKFTDFTPNQYSLNNQLKIYLKQKHYDPIGGEKENWPTEAKLNPCRVLLADLNNTSSFLKNKLKITFKDCNNHVVWEQEATSNIKEFDSGFSDALKQISEKISVCKAEDHVVDPKYNEVTIIEKTTQLPDYQKLLPDHKKTKPVHTTKIIKSTSKRLKAVDVVITALDNGQYMVINAKTSSVVAHFYPAAKNGVYHVKVNTNNGMNYYTIGYKDEKGQLSYEQTNDFQTWNIIELN